MSFAQPSKTYDELFDKEHTEVAGMFDLHLLDAKVYFEIPALLLGREMLLGSTIATTSDNNNGIVGSKPIDPLHVSFTKDGNNICLRLIKDINIASLAADGYNINNYGAIIDMFEIIALGRDSSTYIVDVTDFFLANNPSLSPFDKYSNNVSKDVKRTESFIKENSYIEGIAAFEGSVSVTSCLSYKYSLSGKGPKFRDVPFTSSVVRSLLLLDETPYQPRLTDSRVAIFPTEKVLFSDSLQGSKKVYFANRWRVEPSDIDAYLQGKLVEPKKQIVFYIDSNFPEKYKPYIKEGVEQWNEAFEKIGFKNVMKAKDFPSKEEDPDFDPNNLKYSCVRYAPINVENAMGPSWLDPRSGEILTASVYVYHDVLKVLNNWLFVQTSQIDKRTRHAIIEDEVIGDAFRYVVSHEIGHCLGFMHNMSASANVPVDSLRSASYTNKYGTTTSIMDYARFNYIAQPEDSLKGLKLTPPRFGQYDEFLIKYNYGYIDAKDVVSEYDVLDNMLREASKNPILRFGKQQFGVQDPRSQTEDLGDDAILASQYGTANLKYILSNMDEWLADEDIDYSYRRAIYLEIVSQYSRYLTHVYNNIGGLYLYESYVGDAVEPSVPIPSEYQRRALDYLLNSLDDLDWLDNQKLLSKFPPRSSYAKIINDYVMGLLMEAPSRCELASTRGDDPFTPNECMSIIFDKVWGKLATKQPLTKYDMLRQISYLKYVSDEAGIEIFNDKGLSVISAYDEQGALYLENLILPSDNYVYLLKVEELLKKGTKSRDKATAAHCKTLLAKIKL